MSEQIEPNQDEERMQDEYELLKRWREKHDDYETEVVGVYHVEGVGYVTGLAEAERIAWSFSGKAQGARLPIPVFVHWETVGGEDEDDVEVIE